MIKHVGGQPHTQKIFNYCLKIKLTKNENEYSCVYKNKNQD